MKRFALPLLRNAGRHLDYISLHGYYDPRPLFHYDTPSPYIDCMMQTERPEKEIAETISILEETGFRGKIKIAFDEWNLRYWHHPWHGDLRKGFEIEARDKNDRNATYTMADAVFSACFLNSCLRNAADVEIACFSPIVNTRGGIYVHPDGIVKRTTFHTFKMYANLLEDYVVPVNVNSDKLYSGDNSVSVIDCILTSNADNSRYVLAVVNKDPSKEQFVKLDIPEIKTSKRLKNYVLSGNSVDDYNDIGAENRVVPQETSLRVNKGNIVVPPHSINLIVIER